MPALFNAPHVRGDDNVPPPPNNCRMPPAARRWLPRLAMSFIVIAAVLAWEAYQSATGHRGPVPHWRILLYFLAAAMALALGMEGMRLRHRPPDDDLPRDPEP